MLLIYISGCIFVVAYSIPFLLGPLAVSDIRKAQFQQIDVTLLLLYVHIYVENIQFSEILNMIILRIEDSSHNYL